MTKRTKREGGWSQLTLLPGTPVKACLEIWDPHADDNTVLVSMHLYDSGNKLLAARVTVAPIDEHWRTALDLGTVWLREAYEIAHGPFDS